MSGNCAQREVALVARRGLLLKEQKSSRGGSFDRLTPADVTYAIESAFDIRLEGLLVPYPSYINRVYGIRTDEGVEYVVKFYRPDRWSEDALREEHRFLLDCAEAELPVVAPIADSEGETLQVLALSAGGSEGPEDPSGKAPHALAAGHAPDAEADNEERDFPFALFPKMGGRNFDPEADEDWRRLGALVGRLHQVATKRSASFRSTCTPDLTQTFVEELLGADLVDSEVIDDFGAICRDTIASIRPLFAGGRLQRLHGDLHRGNILDRPDTGLMLFDFDDMMVGPPVQDLWLLLPGRTGDSKRELELLLEAYEDFAPLDRSALALIEPLRFMRMVYFLAWRARQRNDYWFRSSFPDWGTKAFWLKEIEDLRDQARVIATSEE